MLVKKIFAYLFLIATKIFYISATDIISKNFNENLTVINSTSSISCSKNMAPIAVYYRPDQVMQTKIAPASYNYQNKNFIVNKNSYLNLSRNNFIRITPYNHKLNNQNFIYLRPATLSRNVHRCGFAQNTNIIKNNYVNKEIKSINGKEQSLSETKSSEIDTQKEENSTKKQEKIRKNKKQNQEKINTQQKEVKIIKKQIKQISRKNKNQDRIKLLRKSLAEKKINENLGDKDHARLISKEVAYQKRSNLETKKYVLENYGQHLYEKYLDNDERNKNILLYLAKNEIELAATEAEIFANNKLIKKIEAKEQKAQHSNSNNNINSGKKSDYKVELNAILSINFDIYTQETIDSIKKVKNESQYNQKFLVPLRGKIEGIIFKLYDNLANKIEDLSLPELKSLKANLTERKVYLNSKIEPTKTIRNKCYHEYFDTKNGPLAELLAEAEKNDIVCKTKINILERCLEKIDKEISKKELEENKNLLSPKQAYDAKQNNQTFFYENHQRYTQERFDAASKDIYNGNTFRSQEYCLDKNLEKALLELGQNTDSFKIFYGNESQHTSHKQLLETGELLLKSHVNQNMKNLGFKLMAPSNGFNKIGKTKIANCIIDFCNSIANGLKNGVIAYINLEKEIIKTEIEIGIKTGIAVAKGLLRAANGVAHTLCNPGQFLKSNLELLLRTILAFDALNFDQDIAHGVNEKEIRARADAIVNAAKKTNNYLINRGFYGILEDATAAVAETYVTGKCLGIASRLCTSVPKAAAGLLVATKNFAFPKSFGLQQLKAKILFETKDFFYKNFTDYYTRNPLPVVEGVLVPEGVSIAGEIRSTGQVFIGENNLVKTSIENNSLTQRAPIAESTLTAETQPALVQLTENQACNNTKPNVIGQQATNCQSAISESVTQRPQVRQAPNVERVRVFERVSDADCENIYRLFGNKFEITNNSSIDALRSENLNFTEIRWDSDFLKHIFGKEIKPDGQYGGFHVDQNLNGVRAGIVPFDKIAIDPNTGVIVLRTDKASGKYLHKSLFRKDMGNEAAFNEIRTSLNNIKEVKYSEGKTRAIIKTISQNKIPIKIVVEVDEGKIVTAHPCLSDDLMANLQYFNLETFLNSNL